jgi:hypothetical protein
MPRTTDVSSQVAFHCSGQQRRRIAQDKKLPHHNTSTLHTTFTPAWTLQRCLLVAADSQHSSFFQLIHFRGPKTIRQRSSVLPTTKTRTFTCAHISNYGTHNLGLIWFRKGTKWRAVVKTVTYLRFPYKARNSSDELGDYALNKKDCASRSYLELVNMMTGIWLVFIICLLKIWMRMSYPFVDPPSHSPACLYTCVH